MDEWARPNRIYHDSNASRYEEIVRPQWLPNSVFRFRDAFTPFIEEMARDSRVLEIGPGPGDFCHELVALGFQDIHAVDISPVMAEKVAAKYDCVRAVAGDATQLPYKDESFDFINVKGCLHHLSSVSDAISEIRRCLKPSGRFRIQEPNAASFLVTAEATSEIERPLDLAEMERLLAHAGLSVELRRSFLHFQMARLLADGGLDKHAMDAVIDALNPTFDQADQGEIFMIVGRKRTDAACRP